MRLRSVVAVIATLGLLLSGGIGWVLYQGSARGLESRKGRLQQAATTPAGTDAVSDLFDLTLGSSTGSAVRAMVRVPRGGSPPYPAVVLVGGIELGRRVAALPGLNAIARYAIIVSPDYPIVLEPRLLESADPEDLPAIDRQRVEAFYRCE